MTSDSQYYDDERITYDRADEFVELYIDEYEPVRTRVTSKSVLQAYNQCTCTHNVERVYDALSSRLEVARSGGSQITQFYMPDHEPKANNTHSD